MKNRIKAILTFAAMVLVAAVTLFPSDSFAANIDISASRDDIYNQLKAAANVNVTANTFKKCISHIWDEDDSFWWTGSLDAGEIKNYDIFDGGNTAISASLWLEEAITGEATDSAVYCDEGGENNVFKQLTIVTETDYKFWVCDGGSHGILQRAKKDWWAITGWVYKLDADKNCNSFNDSGYWLKASDAADKFKALYTKWRNDAVKENPFLPKYDDLGKFNNVDGYFAYIADFNAKCSADKETVSSKQSSTDYTPITQYTVSDKSVKAQTLYYHVNDNKTWKYSLSSDNPAKSCQGLLDRVSTLENTFNGIERNKRTAGYGGNILAELEDACKNAKTADGNNGWTELKTKLQEIIDDPESSEELKADATANLEKLNDIIDNNKYVESSGTEDSDEGKLYQCANIDGLNINVENYESGAVDISDPGKEDAETPPTCANSGGAESLGWIVCPLLNWMGNATEEMYNETIKPLLQISPELFGNNDPNSSTKQAWNVFQAIANICFIILFMVVIFSQLTGIGIDNYGVKRILPKLIIAAILINLSYYICLIAVDISNIVGNGLQAMFSGLPSNAGISYQGDAGDVVESIASTGLSFVLIVGIVMAAGAAIWANPAILLSFAVALLGVFISIFFLFILLAGREAAIVVLTVISPLAFACYMLPNTKKLFDKWLKMGQGLLMVYPIAGLLVGGGDYVSRLMLSTGVAGAGLWSAIVAMLVGIIPIFFIPTVLKGSFAALGNLGATISGFGNRMRGATTSGIRNSEGFKDMSNRTRAGVDRNGNLTRLGKWRAQSAQSDFAKKGIGRFMLGGVARSQARGMAAAGKTRTEDEAAGAALINEMAKEGIAKAGGERAYYEGRFRDAAKRGDITGMNSAIEAMRSSNMKAKDIASVVRTAENDGTFRGSMGANERASYMRDLAKKYGNDFMSTDFELNDFARKGGMSKSGGAGTLGNYGDWAKAEIGMDDIKPGDFGQMSGDSMAGMLTSGLVDASMAQRAIVENPNLSVDKKLMLSAVANGVNFDPSVAIKDQVKQWMSNNFSSAATQASGAVIDRDLIAAWSAATPESVNIVQNFNAGGKQIESVEVNIKHNPPK
ncbi:MAG: hypothetical protein Q4B29_00930 [Candidatus Saccharibacteria bacterium]|nr:hypothetical protein [Candidatus Saccharibacteria bacterium]